MKVIIIKSPADLERLFYSFAQSGEESACCDECEEECPNFDPDAGIPPFSERPAPENCTGEENIWEFTRDLRDDLDLAGRTVVKQQAELKELRSDVDLLMDGTAKLIKHVKRLVRKEDARADARANAATTLDAKAAAITAAIDDAFARIRSGER